MKKINSLRSVTERSVDNLQTLYTVVVGLALVEGIKSILNLRTDTNLISINLKSLPTFFALVFTLIPFHHGANRYLDETYIDSRNPRHPLTGLVDFFFFFFEAIIFYSMALLIPQPKSFFFALLLLLVIDIVWLIFVYFSASESFGKIRHWLWLNAATVLIVFIFIVSKFMAEDINKWIVLASIVLVRTVLDYFLEWSFFWPKYEKNAT